MTSQPKTATLTEHAAAIEAAIAAAYKDGYTMSYEATEDQCTCCTPNEIELEIFESSDYAGTVIKVCKLVY